MSIKIWPNVKLGPVGTSIVHQIIEAHYSKLSEIYITSGMDGDHGSVSHHYGLTYQGSPTAAVDVGGGGVTTAGSRHMRDFAKWCYDNFADQIVELIHTTPYADDEGFYVKNGKKLPNGGGVYSQSTMNAHKNHIHLAMSKAQVATVVARLSKQAPPPPPAQPSNPPKSKNYLGIPYVPAKGMGELRPSTLLLVMHATDNPRASAEDEAAYSARRTDDVSAHLFVDEDSEVQTVPLNRIAWDAYPTANLRSIHIEMCGASGKITTKTWKRAAKWAAIICHDWGIPIIKLYKSDLANNRKGITGHADVTEAWHTGPDAGASHTDPGAAFPWSAFIAEVKRQHDMMWPPPPPPQPQPQPEPAPEPAPEAPDIAGLLTTLATETKALEARIVALEAAVRSALDLVKAQNTTLYLTGSWSGVMSGKFTGQATDQPPEGSGGSDAS